MYCENLSRQLLVYFCAVASRMAVLLLDHNSLVLIEKAGVNCSMQYSGGLLLYSEGDIMIGWSIG